MRRTPDLRLRRRGGRPQQLRGDPAHRRTARKGPGDDVPDLDALDLDGTEDGEPDDEDADGGPSTASGESVPHGPVGDAQVLEDLGVTEKELRSMTEDAVSEIAEALGASEVLETVR